MRRQTENDGWIGGALAVKRPIQFYAFAWGSTVGTLTVAMWNRSLVDDLGRSGVLQLFTIHAVVLLAILVSHHLTCRK